MAIWPSFAMARGVVRTPPVEQTRAPVAPSSPALPGGDVADAMELDPAASYIITGSKPESYKAGVDKKVKRSGQASAVLKSIEPEVDGFGTLMQMFAPGKFAGKRMRLSAEIRADNVTDWAGLWVRVDGAGRNSLAFDNMQDRPIRGNVDWRRFEVVLDVAQEAIAVAFGVLLSGTGAVWIDDVKVEVVSAAVPVTGRRRVLDAPENLDFEK